MNLDYVGTALGLLEMAAITATCAAREKEYALADLNKRPLIFSADHQREIQAALAKVTDPIVVKKKATLLTQQVLKWIAEQGQSVEESRKEAIMHATTELGALFKDKVDQVEAAWQPFQQLAKTYDPDAGLKQIDGLI